MNSLSFKKLQLAWPLLLVLVTVSCSSLQKPPLPPPVVNVTLAPSLMHSVTVGEISGGKDWLVRPNTELSESTFKNMLERTFAAQGMLAAENQPARYMIAATMNYDAPDIVTPWSELTVNLDTTYDVISTQTHQIIWRTTIHSTASAPPLHDGNVLVAILVGTPAENRNRTQNVSGQATQNNMEEFCKRIVAAFSQQRAMY